MLPSSGATVEGDVPPGLIVATQMWTLCSYQPPAHVITCRLTLDNTQQAHALLLILTLSPSSSLPLPLSLQLYLSLSTSLSLPLSLYLFLYIFYLSAYLSLHRYLSLYPLSLWPCSHLALTCNLVDALR